MKKLVSLLFLIGSMARADIGGFFTYPEGDNGEVQFNGDGVFEGDPQMTFSTTTNRLSVDSIYVSSIVFRADGSTQTISGGGGGVTIGNAVSGGTSGAVLYNDASGNLGNDSLFTFSTPTKTLSIGGPTWDAASTMFTVRNQGASYGGVFLSDDWSTGVSGQALYFSPDLSGVGIGAAYSGGASVTDLNFKDGYITTTKKMVVGLNIEPNNDLEVGDGGMSIGADYAGQETAPTDGLIVKGDVGIGTSLPTSKLTISNGDIKISTTTGSRGIIFQDGTTQTTAASGMSIGGTVTSGTTGSVLFAGAGPVLAQDNTSLFFDDSNNRLGIGTASPSAKLTLFGGDFTMNSSPGAVDRYINFSINDSIQEFIHYRSYSGSGINAGFDFSGKYKIETGTGFVGIGTLSPSTRLHVSSGVVTVNGTGSATVLTSPATNNAVALTVNQNDTTNNPIGASFNSATTNSALTATCTGNNPVNDTDRGCMFLDNTSNTGVGLNIYSNQASAAGFGALLRIHADNSSFAQPALHIVQDGTSGAAASIRLDGVSPQIEFVETDQVSPAGKYELQVQGDLGFLNGRNSGDSSFEDLWKFARVGLGYTNGGYVANMQAVRYRFYDLDSSNYVSFRASDTVASNVAFIWPAADGSSGQAMITNGSGALSFGTVAGSSDNLGNHTATTTINMAGFGLINVASITMTPAAIVQSSTFTTQTFITSADGGTNNSTTTLTAASGVNAVTGLSFDANGTGNILKKYEYLMLTQEHFIYSNSTPTISTSSGVYTFGRPTFSNSVSSQTNCAGYAMTVPEDIDTSVEWQVSRLKFILGNTDTGTHRYVMAYYQTADSAVPTATLGSGTSPINFDFAGDGSGASGDVETVSSTALTGWAASLVAGRHLIIEACRDGDAAQDTSTVNSTLDTIVLRYATTQ